MYICCDKLIEAEYEANFVGYALGLMIRTTDKKETQKKDSYAKDCQNKEKQMPTIN